VFVLGLLKHKLVAMDLQVATDSMGNRENQDKHNSDTNTRAPVEDPVEDASH
jgi:hypothetical protein